MRLAPSGRLAGEVRPPGDKSISHRALILAALGDGSSRLGGLSDGMAVAATRAALAALGVRFDDLPGGAVRVHGTGVLGLRPPTAPLDCGNSGTTLRLLLGVLAGQTFGAELTGDASLSRRPMRRVTAPLRAMGAVIEGPDDAGRPPLSVRGCRPLRPLSHASPRASAQVKSALLLAGLYAEGRTEVTEPYRSRDHTEQMLLRRGAPLRVDGLTVSLHGPLGALAAADEDVPADPSSAAFPLCAAAMLPGSEVTARGVCLSDTRTGFLDVLQRMGAEVAADPATGDVTVRGPATLRGTTVGGELLVRCLDEVPILAVVAARAAGTTVLRDAAELRVKESDRIAGTGALLRRLGVEVEERPDGLVVVGAPGRPFRSFTFAAPGDHRLVMAGAVAALAADGPCDLGPDDAVATSWPAFFEVLGGLHA